MLYGREAEVRHLTQLLTEAESGRSAALAVIAEPGGGKSALLGLAGETAARREPVPFHILRCTGIESESELPFAALQLLLAPALHHLDALPAPQAAALRGALGLDVVAGPVGADRPGAGPAGADRFLIGLAALSLLAELSGDRPVLCLVDDAQWLDRPSTEALLFAGRRLAAEGVVLIFAGREEFAAPGLPELRPGRLDRTAGRSLLAEHAPGLPAHLRERILAEAAGNPLALLELPRTDTETGPASPGEPLPLPHRLQQTYRRRIDALPPETGTALLLAAAEETGELAVVLRALDGLGVPAEALVAAERAELVIVTGQSVAFRHPLIRAAAYRGAPFTERLAAHAALAETLAEGLADAPPTEDPGPLLDRIAWHRAAAATGPDETAAAALDSAAQRARERAGYAAAAAAWERAAHLTPAGPAQVARLLPAAETAADAGQPDRALRLATLAGQLTEEPRHRARLARVRARIEFDHGSLRTAHQVLLSATEAVAPLDPDLAEAMLVDAFRTAWTAGDTERTELTLQQLHALPPTPRRTVLTAAIGGTLKLLTEDAATGVAQLRAAVAQSVAPRPGSATGSVARSTSASVRQPPPDMLLAAALQAELIGDFDTARDILQPLIAACRTHGMVGWLPPLLCTLTLAEAHLGRFHDAGAGAAEAARIAEDTGQPSRVAQAEAMLAYLAGISGQEERCRTLAGRSLRTFAAESNAVSTGRAHWALAVLDLGAGRHEAALDRMETAARGPVRFVGNSVSFAADQVEAAIRLGRPERAAEPLARIDWWAEAAPAAWSSAIRARCHALVDAGDGTGWATALELHGENRPFDRARTLLLHGEWLRRERRKTEARTQLRDALEAFERLGATPWAEHARAELRAAGEGTALSRGNGGGARGGGTNGSEADSSGASGGGAELAALLTPQELQVVQLAATGATNKEIGSQLFLSPKTIGHHLYRAFPKLGVSTRTELARLRLS